MNKRIIIGLGPGFCGLKNLAILAGIPHANHPRLPWSSTTLSVAQRVARLPATDGVAGEACWYYLPFAEMIIGGFPASICACLLPTKDEFMRRACGRLDFTQDDTLPRWYASNDEATEMYWGMYVAWSHSIAEVFPTRFRIFPDVTSRGLVEFLNGK